MLPRFFISAPLCAIGLLILLPSYAHAGEPPWIGGEETRTRITALALDCSGQRVLFESPHRLAAPDWLPDGQGLIVNGGGKLWRLPTTGGPLEAIDTGPAGWIDVDHGVSPNGQVLAFTANGALFREPFGSEPVKLAPAAPSYFHSWSPDGQAIVYTAIRGGNLDVYATRLEDGPERRLTTNARADDSPQFAPDGRWVYFVSDRAGNRDIWRMPAAGAGPGDSRAERITRDDREDIAPRPSPDGKWLYYLSFPPLTRGNAVDHDVTLCRLPLTGPQAAARKPEVVQRMVGGHGTLGARPFAPDGKSLAYAAFEPPPPTVRIVLFTPSDVKPPPIAAQRLTQIADATERFLVDGMNRWKYPPAVEHIFRRNADGTVEFVAVKGSRPSSDPCYTKSSCHEEAIAKAQRKLKIDGAGHIWWVFLYVGERPKRFGDWSGTGCSRDGGRAIVNLETLPGEVRPDINPASGFNADIFLKATIHEFVHAFGVPHIGPDPALGLGNSLMGPNNDVYAQKKLPHPDQTYLTEAAAAMLWKHPVFSGTTTDRQRQPTVKVVGLRSTYNKSLNRFLLAGKLVSDMTAHSVVVLDDLGKPAEGYWYRSHVGRIGPDGTFRVEVPQPASPRGTLRMMFCFDNGMITGDGAGVVYDDHGTINKTYQYASGTFRIGN